MKRKQGKTAAPDVQRIEGQGEKITVLMFPTHRAYIPEDFIWQAFYDFATAYYHMHSFRLKSLGAKGHGADVANGHFLLHLDLKHENGSAPHDVMLLCIITD
jgi:hypothetical protein